jgi:hypothetical protein
MEYTRRFTSSLSGKFENILLDCANRNFSTYDLDLPAGLTSASSL